MSIRKVGMAHKSHKKKMGWLHGNMPDGIDQQTLACVRMWREALAVQIHDAMGGYIHYHKELHQSAAQNWLNSKAFDFVCELAMLEPDYVRMKINNISKGRVGDKD